MRTNPSLSVLLTASTGGRGWTEGKPRFVNDRRFAVLRNRPANPVTVLKLLLVAAVLLVADPVRVAIAESKSADDVGKSATAGPSPARRERTNSTESDSPSNRPRPAKSSSPHQTSKNPLESAIRGMRDAESRLLNRELGQPTRDVQQQVVRDLEALIEQAKRQPSSTGASPQSSDQQRAESDSEQQEQQDANQQADNTPGRQRKQDDNAANSAETDESKDDVGARFRIRGQLVNEVWGHLPPALRDRLRSDRSSQPLPRYEELVRRYFQSLAEENRRVGSPPRRRE